MENEQITERKPIEITNRASSKRRAIIVLISLVSALIILIPILLFVNKCAENKIIETATNDAILYSAEMLNERYGGSKGFLFEPEPVAVYYVNDDAKFYEEKRISAVSIRAYDQDNVSYICTVYFHGNEPSSWGFENYVEK